MNVYRIIFFSGLFMALGQPIVAEAEISVCVLGDGNEIYTNKTDYLVCEPYQPKADVPMIIRSEEAPGSRPIMPPQVPEPALVKAIEPLPTGEMPFDVYRMLSIGMYEPDVLNRAGLPTVIKSYPGAGGAAGVAATGFRYYYMGDWIVIVTFGPSGRIVELERFRARP